MKKIVTPVAVAFSLAVLFPVKKKPAKYPQ
jgi:hypothetical protein